MTGLTYGIYVPAAIIVSQLKSGITSPQTSAMLYLHFVITHLITSLPIEAIAVVAAGT